MNKCISKFFYKRKTESIRKIIVPGNPQSLWKAVRTAKDVNLSLLPTGMFEANVEIKEENLVDCFANHFEGKVQNLLEEVKVEPNVYNGKRKVNAANKFYMSLEAVKSCMNSLKPKNSEGFDRIPQRILKDGAEILAVPVQKLMELIYKERKVPDQWLVAKTLPIFKNKGNIKDIENYRPIANLCASSKIFEKLILKRILEIQDEGGIDLTGSKQHGFKRNRSTSTLSVELLSQIARAVDDENFVIVASIDLSAAFDLVDTNLLIKRLKIIGIPDDVVELISAWLRNRLFYVSIDGSNSTMFDLLLGTVQGSILGPVLYAIFVAPLFDIADLSSFADDTYIPRWDSSLESLIRNIEKDIEAITKWMKDSGLKVNQSKTEACLFYKRDCDPVRIKVCDATIATKKTINVLGVIFDSRLKWNEQVAKAIEKSNRSLNALKLLRKYFSTKELINLVTSNYFSILLYNLEVWYSPDLNEALKHSLFVASAKALKLCNHYSDPSLSFVNLHKIMNRATPDMFSKYKYSLLLYKTFNDDTHSDEWIHLNLNIINTSRQSDFKINRSNKTRQGMNITCNKFLQLNGKIPLSWFNLPFNSFKIKCKKLFLTNN